jgi:hypothetical protein
MTEIILVVAQNLHMYAWETLAGVAWSCPSSCSKADCDGPKGYKDDRCRHNLLHFEVSQSREDKHAH